MQAGTNAISALNNVTFIICSVSRISTLGVRDQRDATPAWGLFPTESTRASADVLVINTDPEIPLLTAKPN